MLLFDRLKLVASAKYATNINESKYQEIRKPNGMTIYKYTQTHPYSVYVSVNRSSDELVLEFTGKILQEEYQHLISTQNIQNCLENISNLGICTLDIESIMHRAEVCSCDVTKDIIFSVPMEKIKRHLKMCINNYDRWVMEKYLNNGLAIRNSAKNQKYKKRLIVYDKSKELARNENMDFLNSLSNKDDVLDYFKEKVRFEVNLTSKSQIRKRLGINDNNLLSVLQSDANPILDIFDLAITEKPIYSSQLNIYNKTEKLALLEQCNFDLQAVEMRLRAITPKNSSIKRKMEPYRQLLNEIKKPDVGTINLRSLLA